MNSLSPSPFSMWFYCQCFHPRIWNEGECEVLIHSRERTLGVLPGLGQPASVVLVLQNIFLHTVRNALFCFLKYIKHSLKNSFVLTSIIFKQNQKIIAECSPLIVVEGPPMVMTLPLGEALEIRLSTKYLRKVECTLKCKNYSPILNNKEIVFFPVSGQLYWTTIHNMSWNLIISFLFDVWGIG